MRAVIIVIFSSAIILFLLFYFEGANHISKSNNSDSANEKGKERITTDYIVPPETIMFHTMGTANGPRKKNGDLNYDIVRQYDVQITSSENDKTISFNFEHGSFSINWSRYKVKMISRDGVANKSKLVITYYGKEKNGQTGEVNFFYDENKQLVLVMSKNDEGALVFSNDLDAKKELISILSGHWFMPHNADIAIDFLDNGKFVLNNDDGLKKGKYTILDNTIILYLNNGGQQNITLFIDDNDGFYRLRWSEYILLKQQQLE